VEWGCGGAHRCCASRRSCPSSPSRWSAWRRWRRRRWRSCSSRRSRTNNSSGSTGAALGKNPGLPIYTSSVQRRTRVYPLVNTPGADPQQLMLLQSVTSRALQGKSPVVGSVPPEHTLVLRYFFADRAAGSRPTPHRLFPCLEAVCNPPRGAVCKLLQKCEMSLGRKRYSSGPSWGAFSRAGAASPLRGEV